MTSVRRDGDPVAGLLASRQLADWRDLRFEPLTSPVARKAMALLLAGEGCGTLPWLPPGRPHAPLAPAKPDVHSKGPRAPAGSQATGQERAGAGRVTARSEPPTHVVDAYQRGDFATVSAAVKAARPGDRILVRPGLYLEGLVIDKPLEIPPGNPGRPSDPAPAAPNAGPV